MAFSQNKASKQKRRGSTGGIDADSSNLNLNRARQSSDTATTRRQRSNTIDTKSIETTTTTDVTVTTAPTRTRSNSETNAQRRRQNDSAPTDATATTSRTRSNSDATADRLRNPDNAPIRPDFGPQDIDFAEDLPEPQKITRRKSLADLVAEVDTGNVDGGRGRSQSVGGLPLSRQPKPFTQNQLENLFDRVDQLGDDVPINLPLKDVGVEDETTDENTLVSNADDEPIVVADDDTSATTTVETTTELPPVVDVTVRSAVYNENQDEWPTLADTATTALKELTASLNDVFPEPNEVDATATTLADLRMTELAANVFADDSDRLSLETLNDIYQIAKDKLALLEQNSMTESVVAALLPKDLKNLENTRKLVEEIEKIEGLGDLLSPDTADTYRAYKRERAEMLAAATTSPLVSNSSSTSLLSATSSDSLLPRSDSLTSLTDGDDGLDSESVSFTPQRNRTALDDTILNYRTAMRQRLKGELAGLKAVFKKKTIKKEHHRKVLRAEEKLSEAIARFEDALENKTITEPQLKQALAEMQSEANSYIHRTPRPGRIEERIKAAENVVNRITLLNATDEQILAGGLRKAIGDLNEARAKIRQALGTKASDDLDKMIEDLLYNPSPSAPLQAVVLESLGLTADFITLGGGQVSENVTNASSAFGDVSTLAGVAGDVAAAIRFIRDLRETNGVTKQQLTEGALLSTNAFAKNLPNAFTTGVSIAESAGATISAGLGTAASTLGAVSGGASLAIGTGYIVHGGLVTYKTALRGRNISNIDDEQLRQQIQARAIRKGRRAVLEAVGATIGVVGGALVIAGTGGLAAPILVGIAAVVALEITAEKSGRAVAKGSKRSQERNKLANTIFQTMNQYIAAGQYEKAQTLAQALTNNPFKQSLMLRGAEPGSSVDDRIEAVKILREKLKTW